MGQAATPTRQNRTITVDFHDEATYAALIGQPHAFAAVILAFLLSSACSSSIRPTVTKGAA